MRWLAWTLLAGCAATKAPPPPTELPFSAALLARPEAAPREEPAPETRPAPAVPQRTEADETRGLVDASRIEKLRGADVDALLKQPIERDDLSALAWLRSPAIAAARNRVEAARTGYAQAKDLKDLLALYRAFLRKTMSPGRPFPDIERISGEIVRRSIDIAFLKLRGTVRDSVAAAERAHADAARLRSARKILRDDVALHDSLVKVVRARFEVGKATQAGLLAFQARLEALRTELSILEREDSVVRARWNRLLSRPEAAPVALDVDPAPAPATPSEQIALAMDENQEVQAARLAAERSAFAVRLAETMTLPRLDAAVGRPMPRADFGVREALGLYAFYNCHSFSQSPTS